MLERPHSVYALIQLGNRTRSVVMVTEGDGVAVSAVTAKPYIHVNMK